mmetsp:Transcript_11152/g.46556  ORF Transcript_11152/g.46556 Transcript_11152/m.46556 type:complete len:318 (+) Transcript_11152:323-1276(+)
MAFVLSFGTRCVRRRLSVCRIEILSRSLDLGTGVSLEVRSPSSALERERSKDCVIFVHGSFHSAWCWDNFSSFFAENGIQCHAISLRGTSKSPLADGMKTPKVQDHVDDMLEVVRQLSPDRPPIFVVHSIGGLVLMKCLEAGLQAKAVAFFCSVPPSGNSPMTKRFVQRLQIRQSWNIVVGLAMKKVTSDLNLARTLFFTPDDDEELVKTTMRRFNEDRDSIIDLIDANAKLPDKFTDQATGRASWFNRDATEVFVFGAENDYIVDREGIEELGKFFDTSPEILKAFPHDIMLTRRWKEVAETLCTRLAPVLEEVKS